MDNGAIIKELRQIQAQAVSLQKACCKTIRLIEKEEGVSTPSEDQHILTEEQRRKLSERRRKYLFRS